MTSITRAILLMAVATSALAQSDQRSLFPVQQQGGKYGYIDSHGIAAIPFKFDYASDFSEGLAKVEVGEQWGYINTAGEMVIPPEYRFIDSEAFSEGLAQARRLGRDGYIDATGKMVIPATFFQTGKFSEGMAHVAPTPGEWGFIGKTGELIIPAVYDDFPCDFHEGVACVSKAGKYGFVDKKGGIAVGSNMNKPLIFRKDSPLLN